MSTQPGGSRDDWSWPILGLFLLAIVGVFFILDVLPESRAQLFYVEGRCVLLGKRLREYPPSGKAANSTYRPEFLIRYTVAGREYQTWAYDAVNASSALRWPKERVLESFTVGQGYPCWYDPDDPSEVVLVRGYSWFSCGHLVVFWVLVFFIGKSVLRRLRSPRRAVDAASSEGAGMP
jgi:hypothetical protein